MSQSKYKGEFYNGKLNGVGVLKNEYGVFEGQFKDGCLDGMGKSKFFNGDSYYG